MTSSYFGFRVAASAVIATAVLYAVPCSDALIPPSGRTFERMNSTWRVMNGPSVSLYASGLSRKARRASAVTPTEPSSEPSGACLPRR